MYDEINSFVSFVKDAAEGGSSKEMAYVLVGEPGNGKTFFVDFLCTQISRISCAIERKPKIYLQVYQYGQTGELWKNYNH